MPFPTTNATEELPAINEILASCGQAPVTTLDQTNPDVAIVYNTLLTVSREVQAEGWTFNTESDVTKQTDVNKEFKIPNNYLQVDLTQNAANSNKSVVRRKKPGETQSKLYDKYQHTFELTDSAGDDIKLDIVYHYDWVDLPIPIQDYIVARAAAVVSSRIVGDTNLYQILQQKEMQARSVALEYETTQGDYTFFGHPTGQNYYNSYQPYQALYR